MYDHIKKDTSCILKVKKSIKPCLENGCRYWIDYSNDLNCCFIAIQSHGPMILQDIGLRLQLTAARIKQIHDDSLKKLSKKSNLLKIINE